jgi:hypothetical protein
MGVPNYTRGNLEDMLIKKETPCFEDEMDADGHITGSQVQNHVRTAKSATSALTGEDTLRLGGALYGLEFLIPLCNPQLCSPYPEEPLPPQPEAPWIPQLCFHSPEEALPPQPEAPWTPPVLIPSPPLKSDIIPLLTPPMDITPLPHSKTERRPQQESPLHVARPWQTYPPSLTHVERRWSAGSRGVHYPSSDGYAHPGQPVPGKDANRRLQ